MPRKPTRFTDLGFSAQVTASIPIARGLLLHTIVAPDEEAPHLTAHVAGLLGDTSLAQGEPDATRVEYQKLKNRLRAALALGVALGLLLKGETFITVGGAR